MAKAQKEFANRMQGMLYAHKIVKEQGLDALTKEIKMRNMLKVDLWAKKGEVEELYNKLSENVYTNMLCTFMYTLHESFGFGEKRLRRLRDQFLKNVDKTIDLDYMGEHYVELKDYAIELNQKYNLGIDVDLIAACQDAHDEEDEKYHMAKLDIILKELESNGYKDAAEFLQGKIL